MLPPLSKKPPSPYTPSPASHQQPKSNTPSLKVPPGFPRTSPIQTPPPSASTSPNSGTSKNSTPSSSPPAPSPSSPPPALNTPQHIPLRGLCDLCASAVNSVPHLTPAHPTVTIAGQRDTSRCHTSAADS